MRRVAVTLLAAVALVAPAPSSPASSASSATPFASLTISGGKFRISAHRLTPGTYAGTLLVYRDLAHTTQRTSRVNIAAGRVQTDGGSSYLYEVDEAGDVTFAGGINLMTGGVTPGELIAVVSTTDGATLDVEAPVP